MPTLTVVNLPGKAGEIGTPPEVHSQLMNSLDLNDAVVKRDQWGEAWLLMESSRPLDPPTLIHKLLEFGINPTIRADVQFRRSPAGRKARIDDWSSNDGRLPEILKNEVTWVGSPDGKWANTLGAQPHRSGTDQYQVTLELEPLLYHKLNVAALENGQSLDEYIMEVLEERADG